MFCRFALVALAAFVVPAHAGSVMLQLNTESGVPALETALDIARRNAPTMREADMAVSLYNALQAAKQQAAQVDQQQAAAAEASRKKLEDELARTKDELAKAKAPPAPDPIPKP